MIWSNGSRPGIITLYLSLSLSIYIYIYTVEGNNVATLEQHICKKTYQVTGKQPSPITPGMAMSAVAICSLRVQCQGQSAVPVNTSAEQAT